MREEERKWIRRLNPESREEVAKREGMEVEEDRGPGVEAGIGFKEGIREEELQSRVETGKREEAAEIIRMKA